MAQHPALVDVLFGAGAGYLPALRPWPFAVAEDALCTVDDLRALTDFAGVSVSFASVMEALGVGFVAVSSVALAGAAASALFAAAFFVLVFVEVVVDFARVVVALVEAWVDVLARVFRAAGFAAGFSAAGVVATFSTVSSSCCSFLSVAVAFFVDAAV